MGLILCIVITILLVLGCVIGAIIDSLFWGYVIVLGVAIISFVIWKKKQGKIENIPREITIEYNEAEQTAKLYKRVASNLDGFKIKQYITTQQKYNPSKIVYTGATVGGVTTGGFHKTDAYISESSAGGSDGYYIEIKSLSWDATRLYDTFILQKIILTDELAQEAKNDPRVKKLLQGNELVLKHDNADTKLTSAESEALRNAILSGDTATQHNITERAFIATLLSWRECHDIKDWISGDVKPLTAEEKEQMEKTKSNNKKRIKKIAIIALAIVCALVTTSIAVSVFSMQHKKNNYEKAISLAKDCQIDEAAKIFENLNYQFSYLYYRVCEDALNGNFVDFVSEFEMESLVVPDTVTIIDDEAFEHCDSLKTIMISDNVTSIGEKAFFSCDSLSSITISDNVTSIGTGAFYNCVSLETIIIPNNVTSISNAAFSGCSSLTDVSIPAGVTIIGNSVFADCASLTSINFGGTKEQWNAISKGLRWDADTGNYIIYCIDGEITK